MNIIRQWAIMSIITGIGAVISYTLLVILSGPYIALVILASAFGPLLAAASLGLYHVLAESSNPVILQSAVLFNVLGAAIFTMMLLVQLAIGYQIQSLGEEAQNLTALRTSLVGVQLGLDVAWDVFISLGTLLFAISMLNDARFGWILGTAGILIAVALLILNLWTFPMPPAAKNLIDLGPLVGIWYLVVTIMMIRWIMKS
ncbi:MAG TPA: hypothetical protein VK206_16835 [Anaerolineales bacterium]|nr:hypothetical protein [Anaerolineales bacterium]